MGLPIQVWLDSSTMVAYINHQDGTSNSALELV